MFCSKCGNEIDEKSEFCYKCGTKIKQSYTTSKDKKETSKPTRIFIVVLLSLIILYFFIMIIANISNVGQRISEGNTNFYIGMGIWLIIIFLCSYGISRNVSKLMDKKFTPEQLKKRKKRNIIISGIILFAIAILFFILPILNNKKNNLQYNTKYVYENTYITFFEDGTYKRDVEEITKANYTFNNETKEIICKEIQNVYGDEIDLEMSFKYLNENEIQKTSMKVLGKNYDSEYGQIFSTKNILKEKTDEQTVKQEIIKDTRMLHEEDNYEYIGFSSNSLQRMLLAFYEDGRLGIRTYTLNKYNGQYEQVGNIQWGTYQVKHNIIYAGNAIMTITSPDEVSKVQLFKYNGMEFTPIEVNNGNKNTNTNAQNNLSTSEQDNSSSNNNEKSSNYNNINSYNTGVAEIKKCLKDVNWLKQNIYITEYEMISNNINISDQQINFIVCKSDTKPIIVVQTSSDNNLSIKIDLVTYENNKVKVERIGKGHNSHIGYYIDANKCIVRTEYMHMGTCNTLLHSIVDGKISLLGSYGYYEEYIGNTDDNVELKYTYYTGLDMNFNNGKEVSKDEYERYKKNLNEEQYNFVSIATELTSENIDLYINGY